MMNVNLLDVLLIIISGHCLYLIFSLQLIPESNKKVNRTLKYLLTIYCCIMLEGIVLFRISDPTLIRYRSITTAIYFLIGPFLYEYFKRLLFIEKTSFKLNNSHYTPAITFLLYSILVMIYHDYLFNEKKRMLVISYFLFEFLAIISILFYLYKSYIISKRFKANEKQELSYHQSITNYIRIILAVMTLCMIAWSISVFDRYINRNSGNIITDFIWILFGVQAFIVSYFSLKNPTLFKAQLKENFKRIITEKNRISKEEIDRLTKLVENFLYELKGYRQQDLSMVIMAKKISTSSNNLSWLINNVYKKSFYQFINECRIEEFKDRINKDEHKRVTIESIAKEVGFKSRTTFYKAFKDVTKMTPTEYIKNMDRSNSLN